MDMQVWKSLKQAMVEANKNMRVDDIPSVLGMGLPAIMSACEDGFNDEIKMDAKEIFIGMIDGLERCGVRLKPDSPLKNDYATYKAELAPKDSKVVSPLSAMFENISMGDILNAPPLPQQPNK